jgi:uncharacterized C2H2 Zn-finger protein
MPITVKDIISEGGCLEIRCPQCRKIVRREGRKLLSTLPLDVPCRDLQRLLSCARCQIAGALRITFPDGELDRERVSRGLDLNDGFP